MVVGQQLGAVRHEQHVLLVGRGELHGGGEALGRRPEGLRRLGVLVVGGEQVRQLLDVGVEVLVEDAQGRADAGRPGHALRRLEDRLDALQLLAAGGVAGLAGHARHELGGVGGELARVVNLAGEGACSRAKAGMMVVIETWSDRSCSVISKRKWVQVESTA